MFSQGGNEVAVSVIGIIFLFLTVTYLRWVPLPTWGNGAVRHC